MAFGWRPPQPEPESDGPVSGEVVSPIDEWRMRMLKHAGFSDGDALRLSLSGADWHECAKLLRKGATPEQILRILGD